MSATRNGQALTHFFSPTAEPLTLVDDVKEMIFHFSANSKAGIKAHELANEREEDRGRGSARESKRDRR
jgi:hypothetical protein